MKIHFIKSTKITYLIILFLLFSSGNILAQGKSKEVDLKKLSEYLKKAREEWGVPGMAVAIVKDNEVVLAKGYGVRDINRKGKVNEHTLFAIASNTKAFTSAAIAILVDEGKLSWDDKVTKHLPYFELYDPYVTEAMTIRDLLCHRSGLGTFSGDLLWYCSNYSREEIIKRAGSLKPKYGFREHFGYSNIMFLAAGNIIEAVTGKTWDDYLQEKFFDPLEMKTTNTSITKLDGLKNVASPHTYYKGEVISIPYQNWDNIGPAGSINSCVIEIAEWLKLQLNEGTLNDKEYFSKESCLEMRKPHTIQDVSLGSQQRWPSPHFKSYGLGWGMLDYHGRKIINHSGGYDGMISYSAIVPEENLGFVILTNANSILVYTLMYKILDTYLSNDTTDWCIMFLDYKKYIEDKKKTDREVALKARIEDTNPSLELEKYTGTYSGELYGNADVSLKDGELFIQFIPTPTFNATLTHWHYDTFEIVLKNYPSLPEGKVNFVLDANGDVEEMRIDIPNPDFYFTELEFKKYK